jgi:hypothetical protein
MPNPTIRIHNTETGEVIDRQMTADEFADYQAQQEIDEAKEAERAAKEAAKAELLERLGITAMEAKLLLA